MFEEEREKKQTRTAMEEFLWATNVVLDQLELDNPKKYSI